MDTLNTSNKAITNKKNKRMMLLMLATFALPVILAKLALEHGWLNYGVTNKGTLLTNELTLSQLGLEQINKEHHWLILFNLPKQCQQFCQQTMQTVHNTYQALGKDKPRVSTIALYQQVFSTEQYNKLRNDRWHLVAKPALMAKHIKTPQILIVDPLGNIILSHQLPQEINQQAPFGKLVLADMKKLLKYSKVG